MGEQSREINDFKPLSAKHELLPSQIKNLPVITTNYIMSCSFQDQNCSKKSERGAPNKNSGKLYRIPKGNFGEYFSRRSIYL